MASRRGRLGSAVPDIVFLVPIGGNPKGKRIKATRTNKERYAGAIRNGHAVIEETEAYLAAVAKAAADAAAQEAASQVAGEAEREAIKALEKSEAAEAEAKANAGEAKGAESPGSTAGDKTDTKTTKAATASKEG